VGTSSIRRQLLGDGLTALCGGALALNLLMVLALLGILVVNGGSYFWQKELVRFELRDGTRVMGEVWSRARVPSNDDDAYAPTGSRVRLKVGNRDLTGFDFLWIDEAEIVRQDAPADALVLERLEWGNFYGFPVELRRGSEVLARGPREVLSALVPLHRERLEDVEKVRRLERSEIDDVNHEIEQLRLGERKLALLDLDAVERKRRQDRIDAEMKPALARFEELSELLFALRESSEIDTLVVESADGTPAEIPLATIVRVVRPNAENLAQKAGLYGSRLYEFLTDDPRESNTEGGIFPAIFGTVMMVFLMSFAVTPLGILAALYLREYAPQGTIVRIVRIAVNNLAGVPSIVFGIFGLGFFVYLLGGSIDRLFYPESLPTPTFGTGGILWGSLTLALLTVPVVIVATEEGLAAVPRDVRHGSVALGATKFETTWRVVLPAAAPSMLTGLVLAMARAAGEVAPLMIVGMVKLAPALPIDRHFPYVHLENKFMHLGFHIYDLGFQSPNVEAVKPLVFATALLLVLVVTAMNLVAIIVRNHLRSKYASSVV
jgi:phosphate transport system permease protein